MSLVFFKLMLIAILILILFIGILISDNIE